MIKRWIYFFLFETSIITIIDISSIQYIYIGHLPMSLSIYIFLLIRYIRQAYQTVIVDSSVQITDFIPTVL